MSVLTFPSLPPSPLFPSCSDCGSMFSYTNHLSPGLVEGIYLNGESSSCAWGLQCCAWQQKVSVSAEVQRLFNPGGHTCFGAFLGSLLRTCSQNSKIYKNKVFVSLILLLIFALSTVPATQYVLMEKWVVIYITLCNHNVTFFSFF